MNRTQLILLVLLLSSDACLDPYNLSTESGNFNYLVVDSFVNSIDGSGTILLTKSKPLNNTDSSQVVTSARVILETENGVSINFIETKQGRYELSGAIIDSSKRYKLKIFSNECLYESDFVPVVNTPPIDSISWKQIADKVVIYANTHDDRNSSHYYRWRFSETWHYTPPFFSSLIFNDSTHFIEQRPFDDDIYNCYTTRIASDISIYSTTKLKNDVVKEFTLIQFPTASIRLQHLYSIEVQQQVLTRQGYQYFELLKKTTENLGSLFDPQPSQVTGNFHCITEPASKVIGFFSIGSLDKMRIFINPKMINFNGVMPFNSFYNGCEQDTLRANEITYLSGSELLTSPAYNKNNSFIGYLETSTRCADCRVAGGITTKPVYWPK
jgi:hypothetical protein